MINNNFLHSHSFTFSHGTFTLQFVFLLVQLLEIDVELDVVHGVELDDVHDVEFVELLVWVVQLEVLVAHDGFEVHDDVLVLLVLQEVLDGHVLLEEHDVFVDVVLNDESQLLELKPVADNTSHL